MPSATATPSPECNCLALRQAARHVTQFYDQCLAPSGLRTTQLSILAKLKRLGPLTINALARELVMDRTTLGRTMLPLEGDGLIAIRDGTLDRRSKELTLTKAGASACGAPRNCGSRRRRNSRRGSTQGARRTCAGCSAKSWRATSRSRKPLRPPVASQRGRGPHDPISRGL